MEDKLPWDLAPGLMMMLTAMGCTCCARVECAWVESGLAFRIQHEPDCDSHDLARAPWN